MQSLDKKNFKDVGFEDFRIGYGTKVMIKIAMLMLMLLQESFELGQFDTSVRYRSTVRYMMSWY